MATTIRYTLKCTYCGEIQQVDLDEFEDDPVCRNCGVALGEVVRIEGFKRAPRRAG
jgi:predicted nucleic acid-binding Zn ribbon protein